MRIAVDASTICNASGGDGAGIEHFTWSILFSLIRSGSKHDWTIFVPRAFSVEREKLLAGGRVNVHIVRAGRMRIPFFSRHFILSRRIVASTPDVLFCPGGQLPFGYEGRSVAVVHDVSIFEHPEWFPTSSVRGFGTRVIVPRTFANATRLVAVSQATKDALVRRFPATASKTAVVHEGVDITETPNVPVKQKFGLTEDTVLFVGTLEPRKNLVRACEAFDAFLTDHPERVRRTRFILAGKWGWKSEPIRTAVDKVNAHWKNEAGMDVIRPIGYVTEQEKFSLFRLASVFFFPSLDEGFGLPVLEAMSAGAPVIASNRGALPEVVGDAGLLVDPEDVEAMSLVLAQCLLLPEATQPLRIAGRERAKTFTWEKSAREMLKTIEHVAKEKPTL